jgi:predicted RNase H-like HicB family nuclease
MSMEKRLGDIVTGKVCLNVVFRKSEIDGGYIAECLELPGCMSQGDTEDEAKVNIVDAIEACISVLIQDCIQSNIIEQQTDFGTVEKRETFFFDPRISEVMA